MHKRNGHISLKVLGAILLVIGIFTTVFSVISPDSKLVTDIDNTPYSSENVYDMGKVLVIDKYGYIDYSRDADEDYYLIAYYLDGDDYAHLASLKVTEDKNIFDTLDDYSEDSNSYIGDLYIDLCAKMEPISSIDQEMSGYYDDAVAMCQQYFSGTVDSETAFTFYCEGAEAFPSELREEKSWKTAVSVFGVVITVVGVVLIISGISKQKKERAAAEAMQQNAYYNPNQANVYYNPQSQYAPTAPPNNMWTNGAQNSGNTGAGEWTNGAPQYSQPVENQSAYAEPQINNNQPNSAGESNNYNSADQESGTAEDQT